MCTKRMLIKGLVYLAQCIHVKLRESCKTNQITVLLISTSGDIDIVSEAVAYFWNMGNIQTQATNGYQQSLSRKRCILLSFLLVLARL